MDLDMQDFVKRLSARVGAQHVEQAAELTMLEMALEQARARIAELEPTDKP